MADKEIQILMLKGQQGDRGSSITSIEKTSTSGNVDTYTVYLSDGTTTTFQVTNGEVTNQQLNNAVNGLENEINGLSGRITTNTDNSATNTDKIATNTSAIATNTFDISNIKNDICLYKHQIYIEAITGNYNEIINFYFDIYSNRRTPYNNFSQIKENFVINQENSVVYINAYGCKTNTNDLNNYDNNEIINLITMNFFDNYTQIKVGIIYYYDRGDGSSKVLNVYRTVRTDTHTITLSDNVTKIFDKSLEINNPTYRTEFEYEDSGWDYNKVYVTNLNNEAGTLYYNLSGGTFTSVSINANETVDIGTYRQSTSGQMYLVINNKTSEVVNWNA